MKKRQITALLAGVLLCAVIFLSGFSMWLESHHDCTGERCEICVVLHTCEKLLRDFILAGGTVSLFLSLWLQRSFGCRGFGVKEASPTLVSLMVRLQN